MKKKAKRQRLMRVILGVGLALLFAWFGAPKTFAREAAKGAEQTENVQENKSWELTTNVNDGSYFLKSPYYYGVSLTTSRRNDKIPYRIVIARDTIVVKAEWSSPTFSNMHAEGNAYTNVCFRTESGVYGVVQMVQGPNSGELYFTGDKLIQGMTVNDFLLQTMEKGESFDLVFLLHEWMVQPRDPYAYVFFTVTMEDPNFTALITKAREANWGAEEPTLGAAFSSSSLRNPTWRAGHYVDRETGAFQELFYLTADVECAAVKEDHTGSMAVVHPMVDPYVFAFTVEEYEDGSWVPIYNGGEGFQTWAEIRTEDGRTARTTVGLASGSREFRFPAGEEWSGPDDALILEELTAGGCVDIAFGLSFSYPDGRTENVNYYFSLPGQDKAFKRLYERAFEVDWAETPKQDGRALSDVSALVEETDPYAWDWVKTHTEDGVLYIRNRDAYPGTVTEKDGSVRDAYLILIRSYKGMEFALLGPDKQPLKMAASPSGPISCSLVWNKGYVNEISQRFKEAHEEDGLVLLPDMKDGILAINAMKQALMARGSASLEIAYPDGRSFTFTLPENDYAKLLELTADDWYIPTFNDQIFAGEGVNPDLVSFMEAFMPKIMGAFEKAKNTQAISKNEELLRMIKNDAELGRLYGSYVFMAEHVLPRGADSAYFEQTRAELETEVEKQRYRDYAELLGKVSDKALEFSDQVHSIFGDEVGTDYELTFKIAGYIADYVEKQVD